MATWNVKSLNRAGKLAYAEKELMRMEWDILDMSDVRWKNEGHTGDSGKETTQNGVGVLIT